MPLVLYAQKYQVWDSVLDFLSLNFASPEYSNVRRFCFDHNCVFASCSPPMRGQGLAEVYGFRTSRASGSEVQTADHVKQHAMLLGAAMGKIASSDNSSVEQKPCMDTFTAEETRELKLAALCVCSKASGVSVSWYGEYGAALVCETSSSDSSRTLLRLIGLDKWEMRVVLLPNASSKHESVAGGSVSLEVDSIPTTHTPTLVEQLPWILAKIDPTKKHQFTPSFVEHNIRVIVAKLRQEDPMEYSSRGAFADVGRHTLGAPRPTASSLAREVFRSRIRSNLLFDKAMLAFDMHVLNEVLLEIEGEDASAVTPDDIDDCFAVLRAAALRVEGLYESGLILSPASKVVSLIRTAREQLDHLQLSVKRVHTDELSFEQTILFTRAPSLDIPRSLMEVKHAASSAADLDAHRKRARGNIAFVVEPPPASSNLRCLLQWASTLSSTLHSRLVLLASVESALFERVRSMNEPNCAPPCSEDADVLVDLTKAYSSTLSAVFISDPQLPMLSERRSLELLVVWSALCLLHCTARNETRLLYDYSLPQTVAGLGHIVVRERSAQLAAIDIARYLNRVNNGKSTVFSISQCEGSFCFALEYASVDWCTTARLQDELRDLQKRITAHQLQVDWKKTILLGLRQELESAEAAHRTARLKWESESNKQLGWFGDYNSLHLVRSLQSEEQRCAAEVKRISKRIEEERKPPAFLVSALPRDRKEALTFFMLMPKRLRDLSQLAYTAQMMLVPRKEPIGGHEVEVIRLPNNLSTGALPLWVNHFNKFSTVSPPGHTDLPIDSAFPSYQLPKVFGPSSVDSITSSASECVWYPTSKNGLQAKTLLNPFLVDHVLTRQFYTETLPKPLRELQWSVNHPCENGTASARGNIVYAQRHNKPNEFSIAAFEVIGSIRAFPFTQTQNLLNSLMDPMEVPIHLDHGWTRIVLAQTMFHAGPIVFDLSGNPRFLWRCDWSADRMRRAISALISFLAPSPSKVDQLGSLADLAAYTAQFDSTDSDVELNVVLAKVALNWADEIDQDQLSNSTVATSAMQKLELRARQCQFLGYAIVCIGRGPALSASSAALLVTLAVRFNNGLVYGLASPLLRERLKAVQSLCVEVMSNRSAQCLGALMNDAALSAALRSVVCDAPKDLRWRGIESSTLCWEAVDSSNCLYSINISTGCVLVNGDPPGRLPNDIRTNPLFVRCFGKDCDFEVTPSGRCGALKTSFPVDKQWLYEFSIMRGSDQLLVREFSIQCPTDDFELVNFFTDMGRKWFADLPQRLKRMHSHWRHVSAEGKVCIIGRPIVFTGRATIHFIIVDGACYSIPLHRRSEPWRQLYLEREQFDRFVCPSFPEERSVLKTLGAFESRAYIHLLQPKLPRQLRVHMPRFRLSFLVTVEKDGSEGAYVSEQHAGYRLDEQQSLDGILPFFTQCIVLKNDTSNLRKILVPRGVVRAPTAESTCAAVLFESDAVDSSREFISYDVHALTGQLRAGTVADRLQLACLHAAAGTNVPDSHHSMTGAELALITARECVQYHPYSKEEFAQLLRLVELAWRLPALVVLCDQLHRNANRLEFLHRNASRSSHSLAFSTKHKLFISDARTCCRSDASSRSVSALRAGLTSLEYEDEFSQPLPVKTSRCHPTPSVSVSKLSKSSDSLVSGFEHSLSTLVNRHYRDDEGSFTDSESFFSCSSEAAPVMERTILSDLHESWKAHITQPVIRISNISSAHSEIEKIANAVNLRRDEEGCLIRRSISGRDSHPRNELLRLANVLPVVTPYDILRIVARGASETDMTFFPSIQAADAENLRDHARLYLTLCVLQEKLNRMQTYGEGEEQQLVRELLCVRKWDPAEHPAWLVFEAESRLQIRPEQYEVAKHLINNPHSIAQLNMGLGKTRVILPMLFIYFASLDASMDLEKRRRLRICILSPLMRENYDFFHQNLTASSLQVAICRLCFCRDISIDVDRVAAMRSVSAEIRRRGGFVMSTPEHILSMKLKHLELHYSGETEEERALRDMLTDIQEKEVCVFDESDAALCHKYQLVYAVGTPEALASGRIRWSAFQALLYIVNNSVSNVSRLMNTKTAAVFERDLPSYAWSRWRLTHNCGEIRTKLRSALLNEIIASPPNRELRWLSTWTSRGSSFVGKMKRIILDPDTDAMKLMEEIVEADHKAIVLVLRGLLAMGIFEHVLEQRYRVDYGRSVVKDGDVPCKRLAVPYRSTDVPAERAEFSQPDVAIGLTITMFWTSGLSEEELHEAIKKLLLSTTALRKYIYDLWLDQVCTSLDPVSFAKIDSVEKIDLNNATRWATLYKIFHLCTRAIDFFLDQCVFHKDTEQYSQQIMATPWNLTDGVDPVGFSGTNDLQLLLPGQVRQNDPDLPEIKSTNGRMLAHLQNFALQFKVLEEAEAGIPSWSRVLDSCIEAGATAVVDCGSLLAGVSNGDAAVYLLDRIGQAFKGVFFFDMAHEKWAVLNREMHVEGRYESPLHERDCFVLFDEARSRGADMKLRIDALAIVTVGPGLTKDTLMQGCGRLRQRVQLVGLAEVELSIRKTMDVGDRVCTSDVLKWVLKNTIQMALSGLSQWARKGLIADAGRTNLSARILRIDTSLAEMYGYPNSETTVADLASVRASVCEREKAGLSQMILGQTNKFGSDQRCFTMHGHDEECERELEEEEEEEEEEEVERTPQVPVTEPCWDYKIARDCNHPSDLVGRAKVNVFAMAKLSMPTSTLAFLLRKWPAALYCTQNFLSTIGDGKPYVGYLRRIDSALVFPCGEVLLLSALESNGIRAHLSTHRSKHRLVNTATSGRLGTECGTSKTAHAACLLYNGGAFIRLNRVEADIGSMLQTPKERDAARSIVESRGHEWNFSDVQFVVENI